MAGRTLSKCRPTTENPFLPYPSPLSLVLRLSGWQPVTGNGRPPLDLSTPDPRVITA